MSHFDHTGKQVRIHTKAEFEKMHQAGQLAAETLDFITPHVVPGVSTDHLNDLCHEFIIDHGAVPAPLNYRGFPKSICTSVNHVICHGIPGPKVLKDGDSLNIDVTVILDGWYGDTSRMFHVGRSTVKAQKLIETTYECLMDAIAIVKPGVTLGDIGHVIQSKAEKKGYSIVREFCGHGLGQVFHTAPEVLHYGKPGAGMKLAAGMFFTIEPMINIGKPDVRMLADDWTAVTRDKSLSAQFEHSIGVTETGCEIFTLSPKGWHCPPYKS
jgi:methionyl aminopeptidase